MPQRTFPSASAQPPARRRLLRLALSLALGCSVLGRARPASAAVPLGFTDTVIADNVGSPTALAFTPDGRLLITTQPGQLRVYQNGSLLGTPAVNLVTQWPGGSRICSGFERGLLGVAVDPNFASNNYIYLFYTFRKFNQCPQGQPTNPNNPVNRVSRFTLSGNTVVTTTETVLVDNMPSPNGNHNGGDLAFGKDGYLYISIGDGGCDYAGDSGCAGSNDAARDQHVLTGKILRIAKDGSIPPSNPFQGAGTARCNVAGSTTPGNKCQEMFAWGLRNPFRFAFDPNAAGTRFYINDVGQGAWEEIDLGQAGGDYGWNCREGAHTNSTSGKCNPTPPGMIDPIYEYSHGAGCASITGGAFVPNGTGWPGAYEGKYLFADYVCGKIFRLDPAGGGTYVATDFATGLGNSSAVHMLFGPYNSTQALYYTSYANGGDVHRVAYTATGNTPPIALADASPRYGASPTLMVNFDSAGSSDPDNNTPLSYQWDFGDNSAYSFASAPSHIYTAPGVYTATLTVFDSLGAASAPVSIRIDVGNTPPSPTISAPALSKLFFVGETITLTGDATDAQDGPLAASRLAWNVLLHHVDETAPGNAHTHPSYAAGGVATTNFTAPAPEDLQATKLSYLELQLTATDAWGLQSTVTQTLQPRRVNIALATAPGGLQLMVNAVPLTATQVISSWQSYNLNVVAPVQSALGQWWTFSSWSDGGASAHTIVTPASSATYTATFQIASNLVWFPVIFKSP